VSNIYLLDNNVLIFLQWSDPHIRYGPIYDWLDDMAQKKRVMIPHVVMDEFKNKERKKWFDERPHFRLAFDGDQDRCLVQLVNDLPDFVDPSKDHEDGDQPLVAAAMCINERMTGQYPSGPAYVVSHEMPKKATSTYLKVPDACSHYGIRCIDFFEMLRLEGVLTI